MNRFVNFFLRIRNSKLFSGIVISVILASAVYAGVTSYDIPPQYTFYIDIFNYGITVFFVIFMLLGKMKGSLPSWLESLLNGLL